MKEIKTTVEIQASAEQVWQALTDFERYPYWNPFIPSIQGEVRVGAKLYVKIQPPGTRGMIFKPIVLKADPPKELRWVGHLLFPGLFDGEHKFLIEPLVTGNIRFTQQESFTGLLVPLFAKNIDTNTRRGFEAMNKALKVLLEKNK